MTKKRTLLTATGAARLEDELQNLKQVRREEIKQKLKEARAQGDLSENAEYDAAKNEQAEIEARITDIEEILANAEIVPDETDLSHVFIGAEVKLQDLEDDEEITVRIVGSKEANSLSGRISNESPMGAALLGSAVGDRVDVQAPAGVFSYKVLEIRKAEAE
ncbi:MAG: transcription elongation factor GreA [Lachnospiraceae bacterium]|nr:transcription elongation factor GreA [Lachnospiraceae bacterium]MBP5253784.1 transcription elongation factor GreA [Lachnospiraceae bacterium]